MGSERKVVIAGGGAAGFFAAICCAENDPGCAVTLCEATAHPLAKVKISGGGRCNVTHACFEPRELARNYPRGGRELIGAFSRWQPRDTVAWFEARGVATKTEADGRMFPVTDDSQTIIDCLMEAARRAGVRLVTRCGVKSAARDDGGRFTVGLTNGETVAADALLLATGGNKSNAGFAVAAAFGHTIEPPVPSLFTFHVDDARLRDLAGVSVEEAAVSVPGSRLEARGPLLVTHWGLSGPAVLKMSAWGARILHDCDYKFRLRVGFAPQHNSESIRGVLEAARRDNPRKHVVTWSPVGLPLRLWERLVAAAGIGAETQWTSVPGTAMRALAGQLTGAEFDVNGKSMFKEEFVTCGGVRLSEVDFRTMQSKLAPGLYFAGEVLDVDGVTGGFNFQSAWTTGWLAGRAMAGLRV